jgi:hypothetical protein
MNSISSDEIEEIKKLLIDLYLSVKVRKSEELEKLTAENIEMERNIIKHLPINDIINYIQNSIDTLVEIRSNELYEQKIEQDESKNKYKNYENPNDANGLKLYEGMLIKAERDLRTHIKVIKIL